MNYRGWAKFWRQHLKTGLGQPSLAWPISDTKFQILSAANLYNRIFEKMRALRSQLPDDCVVVAIEAERQDFIEYAFACQFLGKLVWPLKDRIAFDQLTWPELEAESELLTFHLLQADQLEHRDVRVGRRFYDYLQENREQLGFLLWSSGTTGAPKPVVYHFEAVLAQLKLHQENLAIGKGSIRISSLPYFHCFGLILDLLLGLYSEQNIYILKNPRLLTTHALDIWQQEGAEYWAMVPRQLDLLLPHLDETSMPPICFHVGGATVDIDIKLQLERRGHRLVDGYGLTEAGPGVWMNYQDLPGVQSELRPIPASEQYQIWVKSPYAAAFYISSDEFSRPKDFFPTGDICSIDPTDGQRRISRSDQCIKDRTGQWLNLDAFATTLMRKFSLAKAAFGRASNQDLLLVIESGFKEASQRGRIATYLADKIGLPVQVHFLDPATLDRQDFFQSRAKSYSDYLLKKVA